MCILAVSRLVYSQSFMRAAFLRDYRAGSTAKTLNRRQGRVFSTRISSIWQQQDPLQKQSTVEQLSPSSHPWLSALPAGPSSLTKEERILTFLSANIGAGSLHNVARDWQHLPRHMHPAGMEVALQAHLFAGYARAINALATIHRVGVHDAVGTGEEEERKAHDWRFEHRSLDTWHADGENSCELIYGRAYPKLRKRMGDMHPVLDAMMIENGYGRVLSRPGLSLRLRELCVLAILAGQDVAPQLNSHIRGAMRSGASRDEVVAVLEQTGLAWGQEAKQQAMATLETIENARYGL